MLPHPHPHVVYQKLEDGAVLFASTTEIYFGLNDVGAQIWELLPPRLTTVEELLATLGSRFPDVPEHTLRADLVDLLSRLLAEGLLVRAAPQGGDGPPAA